jgi:hypothetical protein
MARLSSVTEAALSAAERPVFLAHRHLLEQTSYVPLSDDHPSTSLPRSLIMVAVAEASRQPQGHLSSQTDVFQHDGTLMVLA